MPEDELLLERARKGKKGQKFCRLFDEGDGSAYDSESEADLALCSLLGFWTKGDAERIDRLFQASALCDDKWLSRPSYRDSTIAKALEGKTDFYNWVGKYRLERERCAMISPGQDGAPPSVAIPFLLELRRRVEVDGLIIGLDLRITVPGGARREVYVPIAGIDGSTQSAKQALNAIGEPLETKHRAAVIAWLAEASRTPVAPTLRALSKPRWDGDKLLVPGVNAEAAPGAPELGVKGEEEEARVVWREVVEAGARYPKLGLSLGAALVSLYLERLGVRGSTYHNVGDSTKFKTKAAELAIATVGDPESEVVRDNWDTTALAAAKRFSQRGSLPILFDETRTASRDKENTFRAVVFMVNDGHGRSRGTRDGDVRTDEAFRLNLLSTGEESLIEGGVTGGFARVHELRFPLTEDPEEVKELDYLHARAADHAGWPLRWLLEREPPSQDDLEVPAFESPLARRHAQALAAGRLGFRMLAQALGLRELDVDLQEIADDIAQDMAGKTAGERLREALWNDRLMREDAYYETTSKGDLLCDRVARGMRLDGQVAYFPTTVKEIAAEVGVGMQTALRSLRDAGILESANDGKSLTKKVRVNGRPTWMYVVNDPEDVPTSDESQVGTPGDADAELA
jgi:hypothetical protein